MRLTSNIAMKGIYEPKIVELTAILRGLQIIIGIGIEKLLVESNCLRMVRMCNALENAHLCSDMRFLIKEIHGITSLFKECNITHVFKEQNKPAHILACHA